MNNKYGLIGEKLKHSFSGLIHKEIFKYLQLEGTYDILEYEKAFVPNIINELNTQAYKGVNVTIPYKTDMLKYLDEISIEAKKIGAVNTIRLLNHKAIGYNTDYFGFGMLLDKNNIAIQNKKALILGSGGAARAVTTYLMDNGIKDITFATRNTELFKDKGLDFYAINYKAINKLKDISIVINCTPVGMKGHIDNSLIDEFSIKKFEAVIDLIYNPIETKLLAYARKNNIKAANGLYMLVAQAVKAQEIWNDRLINKDVIDIINDVIIKEIRFE